MAPSQGRPRIENPKTDRLFMMQGDAYLLGINILNIDDLADARKYQDVYKNG